MPRKKRADAASDEVKMVVHDWYHKFSRESTRARDASFGKGKGKVPTGKRFLECTLREGHSLFCTEKPDIRIGRRLFEMLKPRNIQLLGRNDRITCACHRHVNTQLLLDGMHSCLADLAKQGVNWSHTCPRTLTDLVNAVTCPAANLLDTKHTCIVGKCESCGVEELDKYFEVRSA